MVLCPYCAATVPEPTPPTCPSCGAALSGEAIMARLRERYQREIPEAYVLVFGPPAVSGLGNAGGFKLMVEATGDADFDGLPGAIVVR